MSPAELLARLKWPRGGPGSGHEFHVGLRGQSAGCTGRADGQEVAPPHTSPARPLRAQPLWKKVLSATAVGVPLLLGVHYFAAEPQDRRRMRLMADGIGRFSR